MSGPRGTAFVAGATGYTGQAVVKELVARGWRAIAHVRSDSPRLADWRSEFALLGATVDATPWEPQALSAALARLKPDLVFALLGTTRARAQRDAAAGMDSSYRAVDYGLTKRLLDAVRAARLPVRFVYLSSLGVSANTRNEYLAVRWQLEQDLRTSDLDYVIARPSFITGVDRRESRPRERILATIADGILEVVGWLGASALRNQYASMTAAQLARALVTAATTQNGANQVLDARALRLLSN